MIIQKDLQTMCVDIQKFCKLTYDVSFPLLEKL